jgi:hypothetical protein
VLFTPSMISPSKNIFTLCFFPAIEITFFSIIPDIVQFLVSTSVICTSSSLKKNSDFLLRDFWKP